MANPAQQNGDVLAGTLLGGKYRLEEEIGRGAMGTVWRATHETLDQRVAVKIISQEHAHSEELRKRFDTEARAAAKLRSRFVVGVYDNGTTPSGLPYIVMEYLEGECLEDRIARQGSITVAETARIARHVARALSRAHARGIVHRDLKPANIFITRSDDGEDEDGDDWTAKVLDFGIAKMDDFGDRSTTKTGTVLGTPLFMSPEQVRGASSVDSRADIYSFGMVIYNMLTGTYAFEGQSFGDLLVSICTDPLPELSRSAPNAPPALNQWFHKVCARDPNARYQTADLAMNALAEAIGDTAPSVRMSMVDSSTDIMTPLAETYAAATDLSQSGARQVGTSSSSMGSSLTISESPKKSPFPYVLGGAALVVALGVYFAFAAGGDEGKDTAPEPVVATQSPTPVEPTPAPQVEKAPPVAVEPTPKPEAADSVENADTTETAEVTRPASVAPKPRPQVQKPRPTPAPTATSPAVAAPAPKPAPKPSPKSDLDLGF